MDVFGKIPEVFYHVRISDRGSQLAQLRVSN